MKQIYTGYLWRPMTDSELEIMEASRIVTEKTSDAQAGDIYEGGKGMKFRKKPVVIEALLYDGKNREEIHVFVDGDSYETGINEIMIGTLEGDMVASVGDWIIKGVEGEFYPCKPGIFEKTYEAVE